jgi:hypothetical protein
MPQSLLTGQLKEKPTYRGWCLYSSFVHGHTLENVQYFSVGTEPKLYVYEHGTMFLYIQESIFLI